MQNCKNYRKMDSCIYSKRDILLKSGMDTLDYKKIGKITRYFCCQNNLNSEMQRQLKADLCRDWLQGFDNTVEQKRIGENPML